MDLNSDLDQVLVLDLVFVEIAVEHLEIFVVSRDREALNISFRSFPFNLFKDFCSEFSDRAESIYFDQTPFSSDVISTSSVMTGAWISAIIAASLDHLSFWTHKR